MGRCGREPEPSPETSSKEDEAALPAGKTFTVSQWITVKGEGEWAQDKDSGSWLCAMSEEGELYVTADATAPAKPKPRTNRWAAPHQPCL